MKELKPSIYEYDPVSLKERCVALGMPKYTADQVLNWIYKKHVYSTTEMNNISKKNKEILESNFDFSLFKNVTSITSEEENAIKNNCVLDDGNIVECVILREKNYNTLCISSQCGCPVDCKFCLTGVIGFKRQLTVAEIVKQVVLAFSVEKPITNIVFMGMGEPLLNADNVFKAIDLLTDPGAYDISKRNITVSTSGYTSGIEYLIKHKRVVNLAFSVGSADPIKRVKIMPIEKRNPIVKFIKVLKSYQALHNRKLTLEYTLLEGVNDTDYDLQSLINLSKYLDAKINLINLNPHHKIPFKPIAIKKLHSIQRLIKKHQCPVTIRYKKGQDITAACGQLGESYLKD
jgi:23S rRNA (adenine2503-C2)-methyltransferase